MPVVGSLEGLPEVFTSAQAIEHGLSERSLYRLRDKGLIEPVARGMFRRSDRQVGDVDLVEIALRAPAATLCLTTALARHGLTDVIPPVIDVALPRGRHRPATVAPVAWHAFDVATFDIGRDVLQLGGDLTIGLYGPERSIVDAVRLRHREGGELGYEALKRWLRRRGSSPVRLLKVARDFPQAERALREAMEILL